MTYIEETWNKTDPWHGCQRLGNGQRKKFFKVREFHFKSGKSEMLRVHINLFLSPLNNELMLGFKKINRICTLLSSNSWALYMTCWNALCNTYPIKWWICEFHFNWNCEIKKYNSNLKENEKQLSLWGNLSYRAKFKWNLDQRKGKFVPVSGEFK